MTSFKFDFEIKKIFLRVRRIFFCRDLKKILKGEKYFGKNNFGNGRSSERQK